MIERLLAAEKALDQGMVDTAGRLFAQVAQADPRNAIALVGLAKVALREDRIDDARELAEQALAIDPDEAAAQRLLREVYAEIRPAPEPRATHAPAPAPAPQETPTAAATQAADLATPEPAASEPASPEPASRDLPVARERSLLARLRRWLFGPRDGA
jgi:tetratricopeptide (TPR) repeat protein